MIDLTEIVFANDATTPFTWNALVGAHNYLLYQESSEGGIDYSILDSSYHKIDGGILMYEHIGYDYEKYTYKMLFSYIEGMHGIKFDRNCEPILDEDIVDSLWEKFN